MRVQPLHAFGYHATTLHHSMCRAERPRSNLALESAERLNVLSSDLDTFGEGLAYMFLDVWRREQVGILAYNSRAPEISLYTPCSRINPVEHYLYSAKTVVFKVASAH